MKKVLMILLLASSLMGFSQKKQEPIKLDSILIFHPTKLEKLKTLKYPKSLDTLYINLSRLSTIYKKDTFRILYYSGDKIRYGLMIKKTKFPIKEKKLYRM